MLSCHDIESLTHYDRGGDSEQYGDGAEARHDVFTVELTHSSGTSIL